MTAATTHDLMACARSMGLNLAVTVTGKLALDLPEGADGDLVLELITEHRAEIVAELLHHTVDAWPYGGGA